MPGFFFPREAQARLSCVLPCTSLWSASEDSNSVYRVPGAARLPLHHRPILFAPIPFVLAHVFILLVPAKLALAILLASLTSAVRDLIVIATDTGLLSVARSAAKLALRHLRFYLSGGVRQYFTDIKLFAACIYVIELKLFGCAAVNTFSAKLFNPFLPDAVIFSQIPCAMSFERQGHITIIAAWLVEYLGFEPRNLLLARELLCQLELVPHVARPGTDFHRCTQQDVSLCAP